MPSTSTPDQSPEKRFYTDGGTHSFLVASTRPRNQVTLAFPERITEEDRRFIEWFAPAKLGVNTCIAQSRPCDSMVVAFHKDKTVVMWKLAGGATRSGGGVEGQCDDTGAPTACIQRILESNMNSRRFPPFTCRSPECAYRVHMHFSDDTAHP